MPESALAAPAPEVDAADEERDDEERELEPEELVALALDNPRMKATPAMLAACGEAWRENVRADDDEGKAHARRIAAWFKRRTHPELHPGCQKVTITVPALKRKNGGVWHLKINERVYVGEVTVWECEARQLKEMEYRYRMIEDERMDETRSSHPTFDLDTGGIQERAAAIQRA